MSATIHVECMMHRSSIAVGGDSATGYAMLKVTPGGEAARRPVLNIALALDLSGSMYEEDGTNPPQSRLSRVQDAICAAVTGLDRSDLLAVVAFGYDARVILPATPVAELATIEAVARRLDQFDVDPGGTSMDQGMALALDEVRRHAGPGVISQLVVLTDGETSGEPGCRALAREAGVSGLRLSFMGIGTDWKAEFIKELARLGGGTWYFIDPDSVHDVRRAFADEFRVLTSTAVTAVRLRLKPAPDVKVRRLRQVAPEIRDLRFDELDPQRLVAPLGNLVRGKTSRYIIELRLPKRPDGNCLVAEAEVIYDLGGARSGSTEVVPLEVCYAAAAGSVNAEVARYLDAVHLFEMNDSLQKAITAENQPEVVRLAEGIVRKGESMGARADRKTNLARQLLQEINHDGRVTRATRLAVDDAARAGDDPPAAR